jgi:hypothetical protein
MFLLFSDIKKSFFSWHGVHRRWYIGRIASGMMPGYSGFDEDTTEVVT